MIVRLVSKKNRFMKRNFVEGGEVRVGGDEEQRKSGVSERERDRESEIVNFMDCRIDALSNHFRKPRLSIVPS